MSCIQFNRLILLSMSATFFLITFPGCIRKRFIHTDTHLVKNTIEQKSIYSDLPIERVEAQLVDVPLPVHAQACKELFYDKTAYVSVVEDQENTQGALPALGTGMLQTSPEVVAGYTVDWMLDELIQWYCTEMERTGWQKIIHISSMEPLLMFERPHNVDMRDKLFLIARVDPMDMHKSHFCIYLTKMHTDEYVYEHSLKS